MPVYPGAPTGQSTTVTATSCCTARNRVPTGRAANAPGSVNADHRCSFTVDATHEKNPPGATGRHARGCRQQQRGSGTGHGALRRVVKGVEPHRPRASRHSRTDDRCRRREHPARPPHPQITDQQPITRARAATPGTPIPCHSHLRTSRQTAAPGLGAHQCDHLRGAQTPPNSTRKRYRHQAIRTKDRSGEPGVSRPSTSRSAIQQPPADPDPFPRRAARRDGSGGMPAPTDPSYRFRHPVRLVRLSSLDESGPFSVSLGHLRF